MDISFSCPIFEDNWFPSCFNFVLSAFQYFLGRGLSVIAETISTAENHHWEFASSQMALTSRSSKNRMETLLTRKNYFYFSYYTKKPFPCKYLPHIFSRFFDKNLKLSTVNGIFFLTTSMSSSLTPSPAIFEQQLWQIHPTEAEIIYLSDILAGARERTRFHHAENKYPPLTQKILDYQQRIQVWVWNLTDTKFAQVHDTLFRITQIILTTRYTPEFSMSELIEQIAQLWEFECQYFITELTKTLSPETYTSQIPRMRILQEIQELLKTQRKDLHAMSHKA